MVVRFEGGARQTQNEDTTLLNITNPAGCNALGLIGGVAVVDAIGCIALGNRQPLRYRQLDWGGVGKSAFPDMWMFA